AVAERVKQVRARLAAGVDAPEGDRHALRLRGRKRRDHLLVRRVLPGAHEEAAVEDVGPDADDVLVALLPPAHEGHDFDAVALREAPRAVLGARDDGAVHLDGDALAL